MSQMSLFRSELKLNSKPSGQFIKWIGSKFRYSENIVKYFPNYTGKYIEPFLGGGSVLATVAPDNGMGSDIFTPLIEIWQTLKNDPKLLIKWYEDRWDIGQASDKKQAYEEIKASFNSCHNGADFLFLTRSCYGGVVRFRKSDGFMSTPVGIHTPIRPESFRKRVFEWSDRVRNTEFLTLSFEESMGSAKKGDFIYCDPPYTDTQSILYGAQSFDLRRLLTAIEACKSRGVYIALSIDGTKKSGQKVCDLEIPSGLFEREILIDCGVSMLKRFQMTGRNLESEMVQDRLLLTYAPINQYVYG